VVPRAGSGGGSNFLLNIVAIVEALSEQKRDEQRHIAVRDRQVGGPCLVVVFVERM
jgi:hypothetical protein